VVPKTIEQILMRCADLENLGGPYDGFARGTQALHIEAVNLKKTNAPLKEWMRGAYDYLGGFIYPVLRLTPNAFDEAGRSRWHQQAIGNLARQWREVVSEDAPIVVEFFTGSKIEPCAQLAPDAFYIAVHPNQERRREALGTLRSFVKPVNGVAFAIPGNCGAASLPDGLCTQIVLPDGYELNELERARILRS
jgi:hypothetical protein